MSQPLHLKAHWGVLVRRWIYAVLLSGVACGVSFVTQLTWHIDWYITFAVAVGVILLGMAANTATTLRTTVQHNDHGDGLRITDGVWSRQIHSVLYERILSYAVKPSRLDDKMGCRQVVLTVAQGANEQQEYNLCLSAADADALLQDLAQHIQ